MSTLTTYLASRKAHPTGQFGQADDVRFYDGKTACGPTSVQSILTAFRHIAPSLDTIGAVIGYNRPPGMIGTSAEQLARALGHWGLAYAPAYGATFKQLVAWATAYGPVIATVAYVDYPNWQAYRGVPRPAPFSMPLRASGANQFPKPGIRHWVVIAGVMPPGTYGGLVAVMEPNHNSPARPENVAIDYIHPADLDRAFRAAFKTTIAVRPARKVA